MAINKEISVFGDLMPSADSRNLQERDIPSVSPAYRNAGQTEENTNKAMNVYEIELSKILEDEGNEKIYSLKNIPALAENIKERGITTPLKLYKMPDSDNYLIQAGHRRRRAAIMAGLATVPAIVLEWVADEKLRKRYLIEDNMMNRDKSSMEIARELKEYADTLPDMTENEMYTILSGKTGRSIGTIRRYLSLMNLIPELQQKAESDDYSVAALSEAKVMTQEQQLEFNTLIDNFVLKYGISALKQNVILDFAKQVKHKRKSSNLNCMIPEQLERMNKRYLEYISALSTLDERESKYVISSVRVFQDKLNELLQKLE